MHYFLVAFRVKTPYAIHFTIPRADALVKICAEGRRRGQKGIFGDRLMEGVAYYQSRAIIDGLAIMSD